MKKKRREGIMGEGHVGLEAEGTLAPAPTRLPRQENSHKHTHAHLAFQVLPVKKPACNVFSGSLLSPIKDVMTRGFLAD